MIYVKIYKTYAFHEFIVLFENTIIMDHLSVRISLRILQMIPRTFKKHLENKSKNFFKTFLMLLCNRVQTNFNFRAIGLNVFQFFSQSECFGGRRKFESTRRNSKFIFLSVAGKELNYSLLILVNVIIAFRVS